MSAACGRGCVALAGCLTEREGQALAVLRLGLPGDRREPVASAPA